MSSLPAEAGRPEQRPALTPMDMALLGVVLTWGFGYVTFNLGQREIPTGLFNTLRYLIATPLFWLALRRSGEDWRLPLKDLPRTAATGLIGVLLYSMLFSTAVKWTSAANVALLLALSPVWGVLMNWAAGRGAPSLRFAGGSLLAFAGAATVIIVGNGQLSFNLESLRGDLMGLAASIIWAWYGIVAQPLLKHHSGTKVQAWINLIALAGFLLYQAPAAVSFQWGAVSLQAWLSLAYVAAAVTVFGHIVWYTGIARVGAQRVMLAMYLIPVMAAACGALLLDQPFAWSQLLGGSAALVGVALVRRS